MEVNSHELLSPNFAVNWPSKSSVLETPERKRFQHSISIFDSGLGSSLYCSSPEPEPMKPMKTSPLLRTPSDRSSRSVDNLSCNATPSPIKSFVHMSSYSSVFSSPEVRKCSMSKHELRLSNPENATGYQFSGNSFSKNRGNPLSMTSGELIAHSRPLSVKQYPINNPCTSRASNRALVLPSPSGVGGIENDRTAADVSTPYATIPETPSKGLGFDTIERSIFGVDEFTTSTPLRDISDNRIDVMPYQTTFPRLFEQPSGPLESSICDSFEAPGPASEMYVSPSKITLITNASSVGRLGFTDKSFYGSVPPKVAMADSKHEDFTDRPRIEEDVCGDEEQTKAVEVDERDVRPFKPPVKPLKPFSRLWSQITFGDTRHQREMTKHAHSFLETHSTHTIP